MGEVGVPAALIAEVAMAKSVSVQVALDDVIEDTLMSEGARAAHLLDDPAVRVACATAQARGVVLRLAAAAREAGPPRDEELATLDVVHALVRRTRRVSDRAGPMSAAAIERAVQGSTSPEDFEKRAAAVPLAGAELVVERVEGFGAEGTLPNKDQLEPTFVAAAFALPSVGAMSPVVETPFGWHIIRLIGRHAPGGDSIEQRRRDLSEAVVSLRARSALGTILRERRRKAEVTVSPDADSLTALVANEP